MFRLAINRPLAVSMIFFALIIFGLISALNMSVNLFPRVPIPVIKISTQFNGDLALIESKITKEIENAISEIDGVQKINSVIYENFTLSSVEFKLGKDLEEAANDVRDRLGTLSLPAGPKVEKLNSDGGAAVSLFVSLGGGEATKLKLMRLVNDELRPYLQRIEGVGKVEAKGFLAPQIRIRLDPQQLGKYGLNAYEVARIIKSANFSQALGQLENGATNYTLKGSFEAGDLEELRSLRLGPGVFLSDVARVDYGLEDERQSVIYQGQRGVLLEIAKISNFDTLALIKNVKAALPQLEKMAISAGGARAGGGAGIKLVYDQSLNITKHLNQVIVDLCIGVGLTLIIVFFFLRNLPATLIACTAIPSSIIATFFVIDLLGYDLNRLTFIALTLSIGIFIDDAIVVIENISKKLKIAPPLQAALLGISDIAFSVLSISVVLLCVFVPISYMHSIPGLFFNALGISVASGIVISFFVSVLLIPSLAARFLGQGEGGFFKKSEALFERVEELYERLLRRILRNKAKFGLGVLALIIACFSLAAKIGIDFLPMEDDSEFQILLSSPTDLSLAAMEEKSRVVLGQIQAEPEVDFAYLITGYDEAKDPSKAKIYVKLKSDRRLRQGELIKNMRANFSSGKWAGSFAQLGLDIKILELPKMQSSGMDEPIQLLILGEDLAQLKAAANRAKQIMAQNPGIIGINDNLGQSKKIISVHINQEKARQLGVSPAAIANVLSASFSPLVVGSMERGNFKDDLVLSLDEDFKKSINDLRRISIKSEDGTSLDLAAVADFTEGEDLKMLNRYNKSRIARISALTSGISLSSARSYIEAHMDEILGHVPMQETQSATGSAATPPAGSTAATPPAAPANSSTPAAATAPANSGDTAATPATAAASAPANSTPTPSSSAPPLTYAFAGFVSLLADTLINFGMAVGLAGVLIYLVLAALYESLILPLVIMTTMPLAFGGAALGLVLTGNGFSLFVLIALILLFGMVGKNAILLVDVANKKCREGLEPDEALIYAGRARLRAILMTSFAMIFAMLPLAISHGAGYESNSPMAIAVISGLVSSTLLTLLVVPVIFKFCFGLDAKLRKIYERERV